jgi:type IV secretory pathway VirB6-like protein
MQRFTTTAKQRNRASARVLFTAFLAFFCTSCMGLLGGGRHCIAPEEFGSSDFFSRTLPANQEFLYTGIKIEAGQEISISIAGTMNLCPGEAAVDQSHVSYPVSPKIAGWQETPFAVRKGDMFSLSLSGAYHDLNKGYNRENGEGLYVLIISEDEFTAQKAELDANNFFALPDFGDDHTEYGGDKNYEFFSFRTAAGKGTAKIVRSVPFDGRMYFRYARNADAKGVKDGEDANERYSPWRGEYRWHERCEECGNILKILLQDAGCLKYVPNGPLCKEPGDDHWINEDYEDNDGGYGVTFASGCYVENGQNVEIYVVEGEAQSRPKKTYKNTNVPCTDGPDTMCVETGETESFAEGNGTPFVPGGTVFGVPVDISGTMQEKAAAPATGTIVLRVVDKYQKPGDLISPGGCYATDADVNPKCCFLNAWPELPVAKTIQDKACPGPHTAGGVARCANYGGGCVPPAGYTGHADNIGEYDVSINVTRKPQITRFLRLISDPVHRMMFGECPGNEEARSEAECGGGWEPGIAQQVYENLSESDFYRAFVVACAMLVIVMYAYIVMFGAVDAPASTSLLHVLRIGIVFILLMPDSWGVMYRYLFEFFIEGTEQLMIMMQSDLLFSFFDENPDTSAETIEDIQDPRQSKSPGISIEDPFDFFYYTFFWIFSPVNLIRMLAFYFLQFPFGGIYVIFFMVIAICYFWMILRAFLIFLMSKVMLALLLALAPLYFIALMFNSLRGMFTQWLKMCLNFTIQPVFVVTTVAIFNTLFFAFMYKLLTVEICTQCVFSIDFFRTFGINDFHVADFCVLTALSPSLAEPTLFAFFVILVMLFTADKITGWVARLASSLTLGSPGANLASQAAGITSTMQNLILSAATGGAKGGQKLLKKGFDSIKSAAGKKGSKPQSKAASGAKAMLQKMVKRK